MGQILSVARRMGAQPWALAVLACAVGAGFVGCSAILGMETDQCSMDSDCTDRFGASEPFLCVNKLCERPLCETDRQCRSRGGVFATSVCNNSRCEAAECVESKECGVGAVCDPSSNRCVARQCQTQEECYNRRPSPTVQCVEGLCVDPTWGCIGQPDDRADPGGTATLKIPILNLLTGKPDPDTNFTVRACLLPSFDADCTLPVGSATASYDMATGLATISGLASGTRLRVKIDPPEEKANEIIPIDFYTPKAPIGETTTPAVRLVYRSLLAALTLSQGGTMTTIDPEAGNFYGLAFDCQEQPVANVGIGVDVLSDSGTLPLYFIDQMVDLNAKHTTRSGVFSILNVRPKIPVTVSTRLLVYAGDTEVINRPINSYQIIAMPLRLTTVHFYARDFATR